MHAPLGPMLEADIAAPVWPCLVVSKAISRSAKKRLYMNLHINVGGPSAEGGSVTTLQDVARLVRCLRGAGSDGDASAQLIPALTIVADSATSHNSTPTEALALADAKLDIIWLVARIRPQKLHIDTNWSMGWHELVLHGVRGDTLRQLVVTVSDHCLPNHVAQILQGSFRSLRDLTIKGRSLFTFTASWSFLQAQCAYDFLTSVDVLGLCSTGGNDLFHAILRSCSSLCSLCMHRCCVDWNNGSPRGGPCLGRDPRCRGFSLPAILQRCGQTLRSIKLPSLDPDPADDNPDILAGVAKLDNVEVGIYRSSYLSFIPSTITQLRIANLTCSPEEFIKHLRAASFREHLTNLRVLAIANLDAKDLSQVARICEGMAVRVEAMESGQWQLINGEIRSHKLRRRKGAGDRKRGSEGETLKAKQRYNKSYTEGFAAFLC